MGDTGLFATQLIPVSPEASRAPAKIDQSREPPLISIKINEETPQHQKDSTREDDRSCEDNLAANVAVQPIGEQAGGRKGFQTRLCPLGSLLLLQGQTHKVLDKTEQIKAQHLRAISKKKKVSLQPTLTRWMIRDVGAHTNASN